MIYWDTSALIKYFVLEPGSEHVRDLMDRNSDVVISIVGFTEAHSALARRKREGALTKGIMSLLLGSGIIIGRVISLLS